jgi:hypothetical protein
MTYELFVKQLDGCVLCGGKAMGGLDCTCAVEAMWLYRASQGAIHTTACHVRDLTNDCIDGTHLGQMENVSQHYGITAGKVYRPATTGLISDLIHTGRYGAHWQGSYSPLSGTKYDSFFGRFKGNHDWFIDGPGASPGTWRVGDPGADGRCRSHGACAPKGFQDIPISLLLRAASLLDLGGHTLGFGKVYAYVTPPDPVVSTSGHFKAVVSHPTSLWNDDTDHWVFNGTNARPVGTKLEVRGVQVKKGGIACYPVTSGTYSTRYAGYYVPVAHVTLGGKV